MRRLRLIGTVLSFFELALLTIVLAAITPGYHPLADTVSRLGSAGQPYADVARVGFVIYGLLVLSGAEAVAATTPDRLTITAGLIVYGLSSIVAGIAPKDLPDVPHTLASAIHVNATIAGGVGLVIAMLAVARSHPRVLQRRIALGAAVAIAVGATVFRFTWGTSYYGLVERVLLLVASGWVALIALAALDQRKT